MELISNGNIQMDEDKKVEEGSQADQEGDQKEAGQEGGEEAKSEEGEKVGE